MPKIDWESTKIACPSCGGHVDAAAMGGRFLERTCPECGAQVDEETFDGQARRACAEMASAAEAKAGCRDGVEALQAKLARSWLRRLPFVRRRWEAQLEEGIAAAEEEEARLDKRAQEARRKLPGLAHDRYYAGEWFQCTRIPLVLRNSQNQVYCRFKAAYTDAGEFTLAGQSVEAGGFEGEFHVFEALRERACDPASPLRGARILPNLFLPHDGSEEDMEAGRWNQIDCAVATDRAVFVIEAKRWRARISTVSSFTQLYAARDKVDNGMFKPAEQVIEQVGQAAEAFAQFAPHPDDRVYRLAVFVRPLEFTTDARDFAGNLFVGSCGADGEPFTGAVERVLEGLEPVLSQDELESWADDMLAGFGDLHGLYREQAQGTRFRVRKHKETHQKKSKGTRAWSHRHHHSKKSNRDRNGIDKRKRERVARRYDEGDFDW